MRPLEIDQGATRRFEVTVRHPDGTPKDLTGATTVWRLGLTSVPITVLEVAGVVIDADAGTFEVDLTAGAAAAIPPAVYDSQFIVTDQAGNVGVVRRDRARVKPLLPDLA